MSATLTFLIDATYVEAVERLAKNLRLIGAWKRILIFTVTNSKYDAKIYLTAAISKNVKENTFSR